MELTIEERAGVFTLKRKHAEGLFESLVKKNRATVVDEDGNTRYIIRKIEKPEEKPAFHVAKRLFDFSTATFAGIVLLIPMLLIIVAIKLDSKGPVFYKQERLGLNGKRIMIWKFRSMRVDAEANGARWASADDDRCTRVGAFLRKCRADELPQIYTGIIPGHLSWVGPRPEREVFYKEFGKYIDGFEQRLAVVPGLSGLAQVHGGYDLQPEEKIVYDIEYIENRSLLLDVKIILDTIAVVFSHNGAR